MQFVNEFTAWGWRGFRYDTAKHIGVHSDPRWMPLPCQGQRFLDVATGRKAVKGVRLAVPYDKFCLWRGASGSQCA